MNSTLKKTAHHDQCHIAKLCAMHVHACVPSCHIPSEEVKRLYVFKKESTFTSCGRAFSDSKCESESVHMCKPHKSARQGYMCGSCAGSRKAEGLVDK